MATISRLFVNENPSVGNKALLKRTPRVVILPLGLGNFTLKIDSSGWDAIVMSDVTESDKGSCHRSVKVTTN